MMGRVQATGSMRNQTSARFEPASLGERGDLSARGARQQTIGAHTQPRCGYASVRIVQRDPVISAIGESFSGTQHQLDAGTA